MIYTGINFEGKEISGHILHQDEMGWTWIREETGYGYTDTRVDPGSVREIEEE